MSEQEPEVVETEEPEEATEPESEEAESVAEAAGIAYNPTVKVEENE